MYKCIKAGPYTSLLNNQLSYVSQLFIKHHQSSGGRVIYDPHYLNSNANEVNECLSHFQSSLLIVSRHISPVMQAHQFEVHDLSPSIITIDRSDREAKHHSFKTLIKPTASTLSLIHI